MTRTILLAAVLVTGGWTTGWADDHGDSPSAATPLAVGSISAGMLDSAGDVDYFQTVWNPGKWIACALFADEEWKIDLQVEDEYGQIWAHGGQNVAILGNHWDDLVVTNYPLVRYNSAYSGSEDAYHLAAVQFPDSSAPLNTLIPFTLTDAHRVESMVFETSPGQTYAIGMGRQDDVNDSQSDPQLVYEDQHITSPESWWSRRGMIYKSRHVAIESFSESGFLRTVIHNPEWSQMTPEGDAMGVRVKSVSIVSLNDGMGTGRIEAPCEVDVWTGVLSPDTRYAVWLTDPDGSLRSSWNDKYDVGVFMVAGGDYGMIDSSESGKLAFDSRPAGIADSYAFSVFAVEAKTNDYILHVQSHVDDYGRWDGDTPQIGAATPNVTATGNLEVPPDEDVFQVAMAAGMTYAFYSPDEDSFSFHMSGDYGWSSYYSGDLFTAPEAGTGGVRVEHGGRYDATTGAYQFVVSGFMDDADNDKAHAIPLTVGGPAVANDFKAPGDTDWFVFNVVTGKTYTLSAGAGRELSIYYTNEWRRRSGKVPALDFPADYTGPCYATVRAAPSNGAYTVQVAEEGASDPYGDWADGIDWQGKPSGAGDDADGDGFTNDQERIAGTDPTAEGDLFKATAATTTPGGDGIVLGTALAGRVYTARYTTDLRLDWSLWLPATLSIVGDQIVAPLDPARPNAVYRLIVELD